MKEQFYLKNEILFFQIYGVICKLVNLIIHSNSISSIMLPNMNLHSQIKLILFKISSLFHNKNSVFKLLRYIFQENI